MATIVELTGQNAPEMNLRPQHREYLAAWQVMAERAAVVRALTGVDVLDGLAPAWHADRTTLARTDRAAGKADSGPRRAHGCDDTVALTVATRAEMTDGLALSFALLGTFLGGIPSVSKCAGLRALRAIDDTESAWASTVTLMGHDTTPAVDGLAGAYRWAPDTAELHSDGRVTGYSGGRAIMASKGGRAAGPWQRYARRHGWTTDGSRRMSAEDAGVSRQAVARAEDGLRTVWAMIADGTLADAPAPGRGKPASWITAVRWLRGADLIPADVLPEWLAKRPTLADADAPQFAVALAQLEG